MLFNSLDFAVFLPIVFILYWSLKRRFRLQNFLIVLASYFFYGWWSKKFLILILFSTILDFILGKEISKTETKLKRKLLLAISLIANLGLLGFSNILIFSLKTLFWHLLFLVVI